MLLLASDDLPNASLLIEMRLELHFVKAESDPKVFASVVLTCEAHCNTVIYWLSDVTAGPGRQVTLSASLLSDRAPWGRLLSVGPAW